MPGIGRGRLAHRERDALAPAVHFAHEQLERLAGGEAGVVGVHAGRELGVVHQPLHARLELDEPAELALAQHLAGGLAARREALRDAVPRIALERLHRQRDAVAAGGELQHPGLDLLAERERVGGLGHPDVADLGDVDHPLDAAEVDERAEVGERDDLALHDLADLDLLAQLVGRVLRSSRSIAARESTRR